jgi:peptide deformylase
MIVTDINALRKKNELVLENEIDELIKKLEDELLQSNTGIGLAAPQIGINKKIAIIRYNEQKINLINPIIVDKINGFINKEEECLSFPGVIVDTLRHKEIFIKDLLHPDGFVVTDYLAVIMSHEIDHLEGILMIDRAIGKNKIGRNDPCPCGFKVNNKIIKYKNCHGR